MKVPKMKNPPDENSMAQANANYDRWNDTRDADKAFEEFVKDRIIWWDGLTPNRAKAVVKDIKAFAKFYAQRCGVVFMEREQEEKLNNQECEHPYHSVVGGSLPSVDEAGVMAVKISEMAEPPLTAQEQSFFIAGFCECVKWLGSNDR